MCGIVGYSGYAREGQWAETHDILTALFEVSANQRGKDATGFVARKEPFKNPLAAEVVMDKAPLAAAEFIRQNQTWRALHHQRCSMVLGHVRWATHGSPDDNRHNHPLIGRSDLYLVHNGIVCGHKDLARKQGLTLDTDVDSELILRMVEASRHPAIGLLTALRDLPGASAVGLYDSRADLLYLARNEGRPLWLLKLKNDRRWFFASTREILLSAIREVLGEPRMETLMPIAADCVHILSATGPALIGLPNGIKE